MEVIRKGKPPSERVWEGTCTHCRSVMQAKESELKVTDDQRDGPFAKASCLVCSQEFYLYPKRMR